MSDEKGNQECQTGKPEELTIEKSIGLRIEAYEFELNRLKGVLEGMPEYLKKAKCSDIEAALNGMPHRLMQNLH